MRNRRVLHGLLGGATDLRVENPRYSRLKGVLFRYTQSPGIYKCPSDKSTVRDEGKTPLHWSVTMNVAMNFEPNPRRNDLGVYGKCRQKEAEITLSSPSGAFVFVDTHEHSISCSPFTLKVRPVNEAEYRRSNNSMI